MEKNKTSSAKKSNLSKALINFEVAKYRITLSKMKPNEIFDAVVTAIKTLKEVEKEAKIAKSGLDWTRVIKAEEAWLKKFETKYKVTAAGAPAQAPAAPKQKIRSGLKYWEMDVSKEVKKKIDPDWFGFKDYKLNLTLNSDISQILKDEKDAATLAFMVQDAQKIGAKIVKTVVDQVIQLDKDTMNISGKEATKIRAAYKLNLEDELQTASKEIEAIPDLRWAAFVKDKKQYKAYQIKVGKSFTKGVFSIGKGLVGLATSPFTGGTSSVLGIIKIARTVVKLVRESVNAYRKADAVMKIVEADIKALKKALNSKFPNGLREIVGSTFKGIIGTDPAWATLPKTLNSVVLLENKLSGVVVLNRNASKKIINALDACDKLEQELKKSKDDKTAKKVFLKLKQMRLSLNGSLDACVTYGGRVENISDKLPDLKKKS